MNSLKTGPLKRALEIPLADLFGLSGEAQAWLLTAHRREKLYGAVSRYRVNGVMHFLDNPDEPPPGEVPELQPGMRSATDEWLAPTSGPTGQWRVVRDTSLLWSEWERALVNGGLPRDAIVAALDAAIAKVEKWPRPRNPVAIRKADDRTRSRWRRRGTSVFIHVDPGDSDRVVNYLRTFVGRVRRIHLSYWYRHVGNPLDPRIEAVLKIADSKATDGVVMYPIGTIDELGNLPRTPEAVRKALDDRKEGLFSAGMTRLLAAIRDEPGARIRIMASTFPTPVLFLLFILAGGRGTPEVQWEQMGCLRYTPAKGAPRIAALTIEGNPALERKTVREVIFAEHTSDRMEFALEQVRSGPGLTCIAVRGMVSPQGQFSKRLPMKGQSVLPSSPLETPAVPAQTRIDYVDKMKPVEVQAVLERLAPSRIVVPGHKEGSLGVFAYWESCLTKGHPCPDLVFGHLETTVYCPKSSGDFDVLLQTGELTGNTLIRP